MMQMQHNAAALVLSKVKNFLLKNIAAGFFSLSSHTRTSWNLSLYWKKTAEFVIFGGITSGNISVKSEPLTSLSQNFPRKIQDNWQVNLEISPYLQELTGNRLQSVIFWTVSGHQIQHVLNAFLSNQIKSILKPYYKSLNYTRRLRAADAESSTFQSLLTNMSPEGQSKDVTGAVTQQLMMAGGRQLACTWNSVVWKHRKRADCPSSSTFQDTS